VSFSPKQIKRMELLKLEREYKQMLVLAFDGLSPNSRATPAQQSILEDAVSLVFWILGGNRSGKSVTGGREISWWFNDEHPHMDRPPEWGDGPLQLMVIGRLSEQMESELWAKKIKPFLRDGEYKEVKIGNMLKRVEHLKSGNTIIFLSHNDALHAREKVQAFTANVVWLDEMPDHAGLVTELVMRVIANFGRLYATFTPLIRNEEIRKIVDSGAPGHRKVQLSMLDNPLYRGREAEIEAQVRAACSSDAEFRARMYGEWYYGDTRVFSYDADANRAVLPDTYSRTTWRHVALADPSASGLTGLSVWAEHPLTGDWYCVHATYIKGTAAFDLLDLVEVELLGYNIVYRGCDCNPAGFYREAARRGIPWIPYSEKRERKLETIDKLNGGFLGRKLWITPQAYKLEDELVKAQWSERNPDKIVASSSLHLCDTARYFYDIKPAHNPDANIVLTPTQEIRQAWKQKQQKAAERRYQIIQRRSSWKRARA
jgi:phage terminase large subunit-like protein